MDIISALDCPEVWQRYLKYKESGGHTSREDMQRLTQFVENREYRSVVENIRRGGTFDFPRRSAISKAHTGKKRIVYTYSDSENWVLKLMTWLLQQKYDHLFAGNLYSFRTGKGVRDAVNNLIRTPDIRRMWSYKVDISNYFNSIPVDQLLPKLKHVLQDEPQTYRFCASLLTNPLVDDHGTAVAEEKGIMAGTPISTFLANLYLSEMDRYFEDAQIPYARYSDDIIVFDVTRQALDRDVAVIHGFLSAAGLTINPKKEAYVEPGQMWTFLGISYLNGCVDVAPVSLEKLKAKMRRKARALARWQDRKGIPRICAAKAFVRVFNRKLFDNTAEHELTWTRWYFPLINTDRSLKVIDEYMQSTVRSLATGKHTKAAYNFRYDQIKELGYQSLVNCYYKNRQSQMNA